MRKYGVSEFIVGHYGSFDRMAAGVVREMQKEYSEISLQLLLPYVPQNMNEMLKDYDGTIYPERMESVPRRYAILRANQWAARYCDMAICYINRTYGGAYKTYLKMKKLKKEIIHLEYSIGSMNCSLKVLRSLENQTD